MNYTVCLALGRSPGLLFQTLDVEKVAALPELATIFPKGYYITQVGDKNPDARSWYGYHDHKPPPENKYHVLVSTRIKAEEPDQATLEDAPIKVFFEGKPHSINLRQRFNECLSLFKAVGCARCPDKGMTCLSESVGVTLPAVLSPSHQEEDLWDHVREHHPKLGEFTLVKPGSTRTAAFSKAIRSYWEHDFDEMEKNHKKRSEAAQQAVETKKFKQTQCSKCPIKDSCDRARWCKGAFPPAKDIIKEASQQLTAALKSSPWPEWQLWEVARAMGTRAKVSRWNVMLTGLKLQGTDGIVATVHRAKRDIQPFGKLKTYEELAKTFGLAMTKKEVPASRGPVKDKKLRALLWLTLKTGRGRRRYGWGCSSYITAVGIDGRGVGVKWTNGSYISDYNDDHITEVSQIASRLSDGQLADVRHIEVR
jgi:hypothetical protein